MDALPSLLGRSLAPRHIPLLIDLSTHPGVASESEYILRQRKSFATSPKLALEGDFTCLECVAHALHRDIMVWVEHVGPVMFGFNNSPHPLRLLYLGRGRTGHYIPIVGTEVLQQANPPVSVLEVMIEVAFYC